LATLRTANNSAGLKKPMNFKSGHSKARLLIIQQLQHFMKKIKIEDTKNLPAALARVIEELTDDEQHSLYAYLVNQDRFGNFFGQ